MTRIARFFLRLSLTLIAIIAIALVALRLTAVWREVDDTTIPVEGTLLQTAEGGIYVEEIGAKDAPAILLIHGSVGWSRLWRPTQIILAEAGYRAIAFDMPPMGYSDRDPTSDYSRTRQAQRILALVQALDVKPIIVAHSFGAGPGAEAAMIKPDAFSGLVVVSGAIGLGSDGADRRLPLPLRPVMVREILTSATITNIWLTAPLLKLFLHRKDRVTPELIAMLQQPARRVGSTGAIARWLPSLLLPASGSASIDPAKWQSLAVPMAFIWGDRDTTTPLPQGQTLAAITEAPLFVLTEVGHIPQIEAPDEFHRALLDTLTALSP